MSEKAYISARSQPLLPWITLFLFSALTWIFTLRQTWSMYTLSLPQFGTMGLSLGPFLLFWSVMMAAMMFPALAPMVAVRYRFQWQQSGSGMAFCQMLVFLVGYLLIWTLFGGPAFLLAQLGEHLAFSAPSPGIGLGIVLLLAVGIYQMTPLEKRYLRHCNPSLSCAAEQPDACTVLAPFRSGLTHGLHCLGCCGGLMLVMVPVGLMNLPWMILISVVIFLEKTWHQGARFSFFVGFGLLIFAALALAEPTLLAGLYRPI